MPYKVGLTGGVASGKSTICHLFAGFGIEIIDADLIARELSQVGSPCYQQIVAQFGTAILLVDGSLNRAALRKRIFTDVRAKAELEAILHPAVREQLVIRSDNAKSPYCIVSVPLLIEANMTDLVDRVLVVDVDEATQLQRLYQRDHLSETEALSMIKSQCSHEIRLAIADDIIRNDVSLPELTAIVSTYHQKYLQLSH